MKKTLPILLLFIAFTSFSQKVTIEGTATNSFIKSEFNRIQITLNDTLSKYLISKKFKIKKYESLYNNINYCTMTDNNDKFKIMANLNDSLTFSSWNHITKSYLVSELLKEENLKIKLEPHPFTPNINTKVFQRKMFLRAKQALKKLNELEALHCYHSVYNLGSWKNLNKELETKAKVKIDSLLPLVQKNNIKKCKGKWLLKQLKTQLFNYEKIIITDNEIMFYDKENDIISSRIENIKSASYDSREIILSTTNCVAFKNKEIWEFNIEKANNELRLFVNLKTNSNGEIYITLDHRSIIKNPIECEKALAKELRTYYLLEE